MTTNNQIDIIIPCLNESEYLSKTLQALTKLTKNLSCKVNIILMDNGSTDNSLEIAKNFNIKSKIKKNIPIGKLRNLGVSYMRGDILVFLDADVEITPQWVSALFDFVAITEKNDLIISGFRCACPVNNNLLQRCWFNSAKTNSNYINSGNMVTTRNLFKITGGFDPTLTTGEDWDFCQRAKKKGGIIRPNPLFLTYHNGYPKTITLFFFREL